MKMYSVSVCLAVLLCSSLALADRQTFDETKTRVAMPLPSPPVIDGVIDLENESWTYATGAAAFDAVQWTMRFNFDEEDFVRGGNIANAGFGPLDEGDFAADIYVGYDDDNLYVAVRKMDDLPISDTAAAGSENEQTWLDDGVEVFVDGDNSNFPDRDTAGSKPEGWSSGGQYVVTINNAIRHNEAGNPNYGPDGEWYGFASEVSEGVYEFEFRISLSLLGDPQPGDIIGFDVAVNDADTEGDTLDNQYTWAGATHVEASYGNLVLGPREYTAVTASTAPTVDGTISAGEYDGAEEISFNAFSGVYDLAAGSDDWEPGDHDVQAWVVHDTDAIYVAVNVTDDTIVTDSAEAGSEDGQTWIDDSVEILLDSDATDDLGRNTENQFEGQFVFTPNGAWRDNEANNPQFGESDDWFAASSTTSDGYQIEFQIQKGSLFDLQSIVGFDIGVNDDDGEGRKSQIIWNGRPHTERTYGILNLGGGDTSVVDWALF